MTFADYSNGRLVLIATLMLVLLAYALFGLRLLLQSASAAHLLTDPFLQLPSATSVRVVWFTEFEGSRHIVEYGQHLERSVIAATTKLSRIREDTYPTTSQDSTRPQQNKKPVYRNIWRHEAEVTGLSANIRLPYRVTSVRRDGRAIRSDRFTLAPAPPVGKPLKVLLTSDHQLKPMTAANLQKVVETVGQMDGVLMAGDLVDVPDRASEWFDAPLGNSFFACFQGRANYEFKLKDSQPSTRYRGGALIQNAPLFPAIGNHEVMGRFSMETGLGDQFNDPIPKQVAWQLYEQVAQPINPGNDSSIQQTWLKNNSFNTDTYEEIFALPADSPGGKKYYAVTFGDIRLISLYVANIWRTPNLNPDTRGRYREKDASLNEPGRWGYGQHIFEPITPGSPQYEWLKAELVKPEFQQAKYKIVMFHHPPHSLGDNIVPAFTDPVQKIEYYLNGVIKAVRYEYPLAEDYLIRDLVPLLETAGVQLVFYGHSHLWNRFVSSSGMHFLETSNVGNTYGAYTFSENKRRPIPPGYAENYAAMGDPNGLEPVIPTLSPLTNEAGQPQTYIASNEITVFSILDTGTGLISSYRFDLRQPDLGVVKFDEFQLKA